MVCADRNGNFLAFRTIGTNVDMVDHRQKSDHAQEHSAN
jgi:hypothetical protein